MLGAIIGDIAGSRWEFNPTNDYNFEFFSDENSFTDDTVCTVAVAEALIQHKDFGKTIHDWCRRYPNPMGGYGGRFRRWGMSDHPEPYGSFGNGSAMRVSAVGWYAQSLDDVCELARQSAECTHNHPEGVKGAQAVAEAIFIFRNLRKKSGTIGSSDISTICNDIACKYGYNLSDITIGRVINRFDETCQGTVPVAFWIITQSSGYEDAVRKAVALGADADTLGAIVGGIAEAIWDIPEWIKQKALTYLPEDMKNVLCSFYK